MAEYLLRVEAINLDEITRDCQDLSTIRGGSFLALDAASWLSTSQKLGSPIARGASAAVFRVTCDGDEAAAELRAKAHQALGTHELFRHGTFAVEIVPSAGSEAFAEEREKLSCLVRWQQMHSPSLALPKATPGATAACSLDLVRPASQQAFARGAEVWVSESVGARRKHGIDSKRSFISGKVGDPSLRDQFVNDLEELSEAPAREPLRRKIAVVYVDGNGFGALQERMVRERGEVGQGDFDGLVEELHVDFLQRLVQAMRAQPSRWMTSDRKLRCEVLTWGGDDLLWIVPAWCGWESVRLFLEASEERSAPAEELRHGVGLVFCHHSAPIHRVVDLAHSLCREAKSAGKLRVEKGKTVPDVLAYQVLESFDHTGADLEEYRAGRIPAASSTAELVLPAHGEVLAPAMGSAVAAVAALRQGLPKSRLIRAVQLRRDSTDDGISASLWSGLDEPLKEARRAAEKCFHSSDVNWFHLADLWDYVQ